VEPASLMRVCPKCNAVYEAEDLKFCRWDGTLLAPIASEVHLALGSVVNESLRVIEVVRADRFGVVYRVEDAIVRSRSVALRLFRTGYMTPEVFEALGDLAGRLRSSLHERDILANFIPIQLEDGRYGLLSDHCPGTTLDVIIAREAPLAPAVVVTALLRIVDVLGSAHRVGLFHGNVTPENVIVTDRTESNLAVKIAEFGVASTIRTHNARSMAEFTAFSLLRDYNNYYAPELVTAHSVETDERTDVFSMGALCYHMLSGWIPFSDAALEGPSAVYNAGDPRPLAMLNKELGVPRELEQAMLKALEYDPGARYGSLIELIDALQEIELDLSIMPLGFLDLGTQKRNARRPETPAVQRSARTVRNNTRTSEGGCTMAAHEGPNESPTRDKDAGGDENGTPPVVTT
jgi:serine/threonine protein kinase